MIVGECLVHRRDVEVVRLRDRLGNVAKLLNAIAELEDRDPTPRYAGLVEQLFLNAGGLDRHSTPIYLLNQNKIQGR
jgi:hypothetical protein